MGLEQSCGLSRRDFLKVSSAAMAAAGLGLSATSAPAQQGTTAVPASEKIVLGFIGIAGRGGGLLNWFKQHPDVEIGAVCDVYKPHLEAAVAQRRHILTSASCWSRRTWTRSS